MNTTPTPYYLRPEETHLPEGHDDSLDPPEPPTDCAERGLPPSEWPAVDASRGATDPPDAPLAPPPTDPARRSLPPNLWPTGRAKGPTRVLRELVVVPDLDPDIAMWPSTIVSRWPFTGPPTVGIWPKGWLGVDNTATLYVCQVAGQPGTWASLGGAGVLTSWGQTSTSHFTGSGSPVGVVTPSAKGDLYTDSATPALWQATGTLNTNWQQVATFSDTGWVDFSGSLLNSWSAASGYARYRKLNGVVTVQFNISGGTGTGQIFTMPAGFRPSQPITFIVYTTSGGTNEASYVSFLTNGQMFTQRFNSLIPGFINGPSCSYPADQ